MDKHELAKMEFFFKKDLLFLEKIIKPTTSNNKKRDFTRSIFYNKVGTGTPLSSATYDLGFYVNSTENYEHKKVKDHIMPPQLLGEFFLDKLCGYHTEKDTSIYSVEKISEFIKICFKVIELPDKSLLNI